MFYVLPINKRKKFEEALKVIEDIYGPSFIATDMLITFGKSYSFLNDEHFTQAFNSTQTNDQENSLIWRLNTLAWAAKHALYIPGDFVECGVLRGFSSSVLCKLLDFASVPKEFYLYDTFSGLPVETSTHQEREAWNPEYTKTDPKDLVKEVKEVFSPYPNVKVIQGIVPNSFQESCPEKIAYLHIDMNSVQAEILALEHLFDLVSPGGMIILDDFGWVCNIEQATAEIEFMKQRDYSILELPTGQGMIIKR